MRTTNQSERHELMDVMAKYAAGLDDQDFDLYRSCFDENVEVYGFTETPIHGAENWFAFVKQKLAGYTATQHMLGPQLARISGDSAHCRTDVQAIRFLRDLEATAVILWATYETDMQRVNGDWKIKNHRIVKRGEHTQNLSGLE